MERVKTLLWFVVTFIVLAALVLPGAPDSKATDRPTTESTRSAGLAALTRWLTAANISVHSQRQRFTNPRQHTAQATGNLAIVHLPATLIFETDETRALLDWVYSGNTLLIAAGHLEGSRWIYEAQDLPRALWRLTGLALRAHDGDEPDSTESITDSVDRALTVPGWLLLHGSRTMASLRPAEPHPLSAGITALTAPWDQARWERIDQATALRAAQMEGPADADAPTDDSAPLPTWVADLEACPGTQAGQARLLRGQQGCVPIATPDEHAWRTVFTHTERPQPALLAAPLGSGELLVLMHPSLLANEVIYRFENRQLAINLIEHALAPGGTVIIDDAHQGLNDILEANDLLTDTRFWASIGFVLLFWLAYLLADSGQWQRAVFRRQQPGVRQQDLVLSSARFLEQRLHPTAALEALLEPLTETLARKWRLPRSEALKQGLEQERLQHPQQVAALEALLSRAPLKQPALPAAQQTINALRQAIA